MRVHLGSDHAGYELKAHLVAWLEREGHEPVDHGPPAFDPLDDYPAYCLRAAEAVRRERDSVGVVIGGSGNGEQIVANKVRGIRAALAWNDDTATLARQHNDANVISIGARQHTLDEAVGFLAAFLATPFSADPRHARRIAQVEAYEDSGVVPPVPDPA